MHIICSNTKEFIKLMQLCEYIHNLRNIDTDKHPMINDLMHLYLGESDFPDKKKYVSIKGRKTLPKRDSTKWGTVKPSIDMTIDDMTGIGINKGRY